MTNDNAQDDFELQAHHRALVALSVDAVPSPDPIDPDRLWAAVGGELPSREAQEVLDAALLDPAAREELRLALAVRDALSQGLAQPRHAAPRSKAWWTVVLAVAAALLAVLTLRAQAPFTDVDDLTQYRGGAVSVESRVGSETLPADRFLLRWEPHEGSRYDIRVSTDEPRLLLHKKGLSQARFVVPAEALEGLRPDTRILWQVEVVQPDGSRERSATFVVRLE